LKILILQERGRHEKNREYREALCLKRSLERLGQETIVWGLNYDNFSIPFEEISRNCDVVLSLENYNNGWHPNISSFSGLKCFWSIDSHCALSDHQEFCKTNKIDFLLNSTERYIPFFQNIVKNSMWFPNGYPSDLIYPRSDVSRDKEIGFVGSSIPQRDQILDAVSKLVPLKRDIFVIGEDMVKCLSSYKISFNYNIADDINFRTFESTGAGALLLTNYTNNLEKLFNIGEEVIVYESLRDIVEKTNYYLKNPEKLSQIAEKGKNRSVKDHSYDSRASQFLEAIRRQ
jgi:spore maturation protein CgeB